MEWDRAKTVALNDAPGFEDWRVEIFKLRWSFKTVKRFYVGFHL